ncbi:unnamed protein product, partial [Discosporangium mesarthrocarpum]
MDPMTGKQEATVEPLVQADQPATRSPNPRRRRNRRRKTLSPSKVTTFLCNVQMADDPMNFPDPPTMEGVNPLASEHFGQQEPARGSSGPTDKVDCAEVGVLEPLGVRLTEQSSADVVSNPLAIHSTSNDVLSSICNHQTTPMGTEVTVVRKSPRRVGGREPSDGSEPEGVENGAPEFRTTGGSSYAPVLSPERPFEGDANAKPLNLAVSHQVEKARHVNVQVSRKSRRRSLVVPPGGNCVDLDGGGDSGNTSTLASDSANPPDTPNATSSLQTSMAAEMGWVTSNTKDDPVLLTREYCREVAREPRESQRARRLAARVFCLTGYPLSPLVAKDAHILCEAAGGGLGWSVDDKEPQLTGKPQLASSRQKMRKLIVRLKPVLLLMEQANLHEKQETQAATGMLGCKTSQEGFAYKDAATGEPIPASSYQARYAEHIMSTRAQRQRRFAKAWAGADSGTKEDGSGSPMGGGGLRAACWGSSTTRSSREEGRKDDVHKEHAPAPITLPLPQAADNVVATSTTFEASPVKGVIGPMSSTSRPGEDWGGEASALEPGSLLEQHSGAGHPRAREGLLEAPLVQDASVEPGVGTAAKAQAGAVKEYRQGSSHMGLAMGAIMAAQEAGCRMCPSVVDEVPAAITGAAQRADTQDDLDLPGKLRHQDQTSRSLWDSCMGEERDKEGFAGTMPLELSSDRPHRAPPTRKVSPLVCTSLPTAPLPLNIKGPTREEE